MFNREELFAAALQIKEPLYVEKIDFDKSIGELHIYINFRKGSKFQCMVCDQDNLSVHDTIDKTWRHLNFFQYKAFIHFRTPRSNCPRHGVHLVDVPWASASSGFTLLFEAFIMQLATCMPILQIAHLVDEQDTRIQRIINRHVNIAHMAADYSDLTQLGIDETSSKKGHNYITLFVDLDQSKVVHIEEGKDSSVIEKFKEEIQMHSCKPQDIKNISCDMSPAFKKGISDNFPWVNVTFDKFHVMQMMNHAVDVTRKMEQKSVPELRLSRYLWLYNENKLDNTKKEKLSKLRDMNLKTAKAYQLKLTLQDIYKSAVDKFDAMVLLEKWYKWAVRCRLPAVKEFAKTVRKNWSGILNYFDSKLTNAALEGINSIVQTIKARARGYRNLQNFINMIYLAVGKLTFNFQQLHEFYGRKGQPKLGLPT